MGGRDGGAPGVKLGGGGIIGRGGPFPSCGGGGGGILGGIPIGGGA